MSQAEGADETVFRALSKEGDTFQELLNKLPNLAPLEVKLSLGRLEGSGRAKRFIKDGKYLFSLV